MGKDLMHTACVCMANTISRKMRLHIMNEKWVQTHTCIHTYTVLQGKLVLINLAGGTRHVFPDTSWPHSLSGSMEAINSSLSAVCLFEFCANLYYSLMASWPRAGSAEWRLSGYLFHSDIIHHAFFFSDKKKLRISVGPPSADFCLWRIKVFVVLKLYKNCFVISPSIVCRAIFR